MKRIIFSILVGWIAGALLSVATDAVFHSAGIFPPPGQPFFDTGLLIVAFTYRAVYQIGSAYITAMIAKDKAEIAVLISGIIASVVWMIGTIAMWNLVAAWYNIGGVVLSVPFAVIGGKLYQMRSGNKYVAAE
ncbi:MAG: hypothetical protein AB1298_08550 [Bacteroidota bacterium]